MSRLTRLLTRASGAERRSDPALSLLRLLHGGAIAAGSTATPTTCLGIAAAYAAINRLSSDLASLPITGYETLPDGARREVRDDPEVRCLRVSPDGVSTSYTFRQHAWAHVFTRGNAYLEISRRADGHPAALHLMDPDYTQAARSRDGSVWYETSGATLPASEVIHVPGLGYDGITGYSPITLLRRSFALALDLELYASTFVNSSSDPRGILKSAKALSPEAEERLVASWRQRHEGPLGAHKTAVLSDGLTYEPIRLSPQDSQFLEQRQFSVIEICRIFGVPPHKIQSYEGATLNNVYAANDDYWETTLAPLAASFEQACTLKLYPDSNKHLEHNLNARLRGSPRDRAEFYNLLLMNGTLTRNEVRRRENLEPIGAPGDLHTIQLNMTTLERLHNAPPPQ